MVTDYATAILSQNHDEVSDTSPNLPPQVDKHWATPLSGPTSGIPVPETPKVRAARKQLGKEPYKEVGMKAKVPGKTRKKANHCVA